MKSEIGRFLDDAIKAGIRVDTSDKSLFNASLDHMRISFKPSAVLLARKVEEVGNILGLAYARRVPVTVRGSGTGCAGGAVPKCGGVVLDMSGISFIRVNPKSRIAHVGAGAVTARIDAAANKFGFFYPPDPSSHKFCSIGGNIACNAGGLRAAKYGVTRDYVLALTAFLADGTRLNCGRPLRKFSVGENLRDFFIGTEGTLGVVAEAWLKLLPAPKSRTFAIAFFKSDNLAFKSVERIMRSSLQPSMLEFMDSLTIECVRHCDTGLEFEPGCAALLAEFDSYCGASCNEQAREFVKLLCDCDCRFARTPEEAERFRQVRRKSSPSMYMLGNTKVSQDIVLPIDMAAPYFRAFRKISSESGLPAPVFGHAADGNYHIHFMYDGNIPGERSRALICMDMAIREAIKCGGAVSGEHGIGMLKSKYMSLQHSDSEMKFLRSIKSRFDPRNILNRGKIYNPQDLVSLEPLKGIKLPWD